MTLIVCGVINGLLGKVIDLSGMSITDRILGGAFGALRGILIVSAILFFLDTFTQASQTELWKSSLLIPHLTLL